MTPLREWLRKPAGKRRLRSSRHNGRPWERFLSGVRGPRPPVAPVIVFLLTAASVSTVIWFACKLYQQEGIVQTQRSEERLQQAASRIAATIRGALAETGERVGALDSSPALAPGQLLLSVKYNSVAASGAPLLYYPTPSAEPEADPGIFADAEQLEFARKQPASALDEYRRLADSPNPAIRAGALLREARVLRNTGRMEESRAADGRLAELHNVKVAGAPADLVARHALGDTSIVDELLRGRWHLSRGQFQFYWEAASSQPPPATAVAFAEATALVWEQLQTRADSRGQQTIWAEGHPFFYMWRGGPERRAILLTTPEAFLKFGPSDAKISTALADSDGRVAAGRRQTSGRTVIRASVETQLPWTLYVSSPQPVEDADLAASKRFLVLGASAMALFLMLGGYVIARVIRREAETVRMQSDFVSAVSHEFRSPLTSLRQLSEMLADNRVTSAERRQIYYQTLVKETTRLQRLVEGLLNFGRMDAGERHYQFEELDAANLVRQVVGEFEAHAAGQGRRIEASEGSGNYRIEGDPDAISVAVRNLVDNALKYSPGEPVVWVDLARRNGSVAIRVRDKGPGITVSERKAIFRRFVRGSAARATNAKGSGVGLTMVQHIVAAHGGEISVASEPGQGTEFTIFLPASERNRRWLES